MKNKLIKMAKNSQRKFSQAVVAGAAMAGSAIAVAAPAAADLKTEVDNAAGNAQVALSATQLTILGVVVLMMAFGLIYSLVRK